MMECGGNITLHLKGDVPPELTKRGVPSKKKSSSRPQVISAITSKPRTTKISELRWEILSLYNVACSFHNKYVVKLRNDEHNEFTLDDGETTIGELGLNSDEKLTVVISFIGEPVPAVAPSSRPRRQAAEDAKAMIPLAVKNEEKRRRAERRENNKRRDKKIKCSRKDGSSFLGMGVRLKDGKKIGRHITPGGKALKVGGVFPGIGRDLAESTPVLPEERSMVVSVKKSDVIETLLNEVAQKNPGLNELFKREQEVERNENKAISRIVAVSDGNYELELLQSGSKVGDGYLLGGRTDANSEDQYGRYHDRSKPLIRAYFGNKMEGRMTYDEIVELLPYNVVKDLIEYTHSHLLDSEGDVTEILLRPLTVAKTPSYFWSLVHHSANSSNETLTSVECMLKSMQPELDWSHLERGGRSRTLSEKAKENLRQKKLEAQEDVYEKKVVSRDASDMNWDLVTPCDEDWEGLADCIDSEELVDEIILSILASESGPQCKNPRQLANADPNALFEKLKNGCNKQKIEPPDIASIKQWVDAAQEVALFQIMLEILDEDENVLRGLHSIGAASPWDLTCYEEESDYLAEILVEMEALEEDDKDTVLKFTWRAQRALTVCPWLGDFSSLTG